MARLVSIVYSPLDREAKPKEFYTRVPLDRATLVAEHGIEGDRKGGAGGRHLNVMVAEALAQLRGDGFKVGPGEMGEQLVVEGIDPAALTIGTRARIGETAVIEVEKPRTGCVRFEHIQGRPRQSAAGRLGVMARVLVGGEVAVGDAVELEPATSPPG
jgi:MOSC domain-containing protein YiiM